MGLFEEEKGLIRYLLLDWIGLVGGRRGLGCNFLYWYFMSLGVEFEIMMHCVSSAKLSV